MSLAVAEPAGMRVAWSARADERFELASPATVRWATRWASRAVVAFALVLAAVSGIGALAWSTSTTAFGWGATAGFPAVYTWVMLAAVQRVRRRFLGASVLALGLFEVVGLVDAATDDVRFWWVGLTHAVAVGVLVAWPGRVGVVAAAVVAVTPAQLWIALGYGPGAWAVMPVVNIWRMVTIVVLVWLVNALPVLESTRRQLVEVAVAAERARLDRRLAETVGSALADIAARGAEAQAAQIVDVRAALPGMVQRARDATDAARRLIRSAHRETVDEQLRAARLLLEAAGINTTVQYHSVGPSESSAELKSVLQAQVHDMLDQRQPPEGCQLVVIYDPQQGYSVRVEPQQPGAVSA